MRVTGLQERLYETDVGNLIPSSYEARERISTPVPAYVARSFGSGYTNRQEQDLSEGSGILYQRRRFWDELNFSPRNVYENVKRHPLGAGAALGGLLGAASFAGYTAASIPYALTTGTAFATLGSLALGALTGGLFGLGVAGLLYYGWFRGRRKKDPKYSQDKTSEPRSFGKRFLDWIDEQNELAEKSAAAAAQRMPRG